MRTLKDENEPPSTGKPRRTRQEVDAIIRRIADLMVRGEWVRGVSHRMIAREYAAPEETAMKWSRMASSLVINSADTADLHEIRVSTVAALERVGRRAEMLGQRNTRSAPTALRTAVQAYDKAAEVAGVKYDGSHVPQVNVQVNVATDPNVRLLFDTVMAAVRTLPNAREAARVIAEHLERLDLPEARAMASGDRALTSGMIDVEVSDAEGPDE